MTAQGNSCAYNGAHPTSAPQAFERRVFICETPPSQLEQPRQLEQPPRPRTPSFAEASASRTHIPLPHPWTPHVTTQQEGTSNPKQQSSIRFEHEAGASSVTQPSTRVFAASAGAPAGAASAKPLSWQRATTARASRESELEDTQRLARAPSGDARTDRPTEEYFATVDKSAGRASATLPKAPAGSRAAKNKSSSGGPRERRVQTAVHHRGRHHNKHSVTSSESSVAFGARKGPRTGSALPSEALPGFSQLSHASLAELERLVESQHRQV